MNTLLIITRHFVFIKSKCDVHRCRVVWRKRHDVTYDVVHRHFAYSRWYHAYSITHYSSKRFFHSNYSSARLDVICILHGHQKWIRFLQHVVTESELMYRGWNMRDMVIQSANVQNRQLYTYIYILLCAEAKSNTCNTDSTDVLLKCVCLVALSRGRSRIWYTLVYCFCEI